MRKQSSFWIVCILVAIGCLTLLPLFRPGFFVTDDGDWMIIRLSAFYQSLREGQLPVRFLGRLNNSFGYPVSNFLYPGFLYIGSIIHVFGFSFSDSIKIIIAGSVIGTIFILYALLRPYFSRRISLVSIGGFSTAPYLLYDIYKRGSVGEVFAFFPGALALYAAVNSRRLLLVLAIGILLVSHNSLALMFSAFIFAFILVRRAFVLIPYFFWGIGMATFFWLPALIEKQLVLFDKTVISNPLEYFVEGELLYLLPVLSILSVLAFLFLKKKQKKDWLVVWVVSATVVAIFLTLPISQFIWNIQSFSQLFQFPYRFLAITTLLTPYIIAWIIQKMQKNGWVFAAICVVYYLGTLWVGFSFVQPVQRPEGYYSTNEATTTVANEYMPKWVRSIPIKREDDEIYIYSGNGIIEPRHVTTQTIDVLVHADSASTVQINSIYYPGWGIAIDGTRIQPNYDNPEGVMRFVVPSGTHHVVAQFRETVPRFLADCVSLLSFSAWFILSIRTVLVKRGAKR